MHEPFYVELSSNSSTNRHNTVANFKNKIQLLAPLKGQWEVGLVEMSYTKSWKNLSHNYPVGLEKMFNQKVTPITFSSAHGYSPLEGDERIGIVRAGYYESLSHLCTEIEREFTAMATDKILSMPEFHLDIITKRVYIIPGNHKDGSKLLPNLNNEVAGILGFDNYSTYRPKFNAKHHLVADRPADLKAGLQTLYVYCDLVEPQYIGDTRAKLLRTVGVDSKASFGDQIVVNYENPHYIPILSTEFENIEIDIKSDTDERIPFMFGRTRVKLHFRPRNA